MVGRSPTYLAHSPLLEVLTCLLGCPLEIAQSQLITASCTPTHRLFQAFAWQAKYPIFIFNVAFPNSLPSFKHTFFCVVLAFLSLSSKQTMLLRFQSRVSNLSCVTSSQVIFKYVNSVVLHGNWMSVHALLSFECGTWKPHIIRFASRSERLQNNWARGSPSADPWYFCFSVPVTLLSLESSRHPWKSLHECKLFLHGDRRNAIDPVWGRTALPSKEGREQAFRALRKNDRSDKWIPL